MSVQQKSADQWNKAIENTLIKTGYGLTAGLIAALGLCRSPATRAGLVGVCAGIGIGMSLIENKIAFEKPATFETPITFEAPKSE